MVLIMAAKFGNHTLLPTIKFGNNTIRKIKFEDSNILNSRITNISSVDINTFFEEYLFDYDHSVPAEYVYVSFGTPSIDIDELTLVYEPGSIIIEYDNLLTSWSGTITASSINHIHTKDGVRSGSTISFPAITTSGPRGASVTQYSSGYFTLTFTSYSAITNFLNLTTNWKI